MLPASNRAAGANIAFPDVCLTPSGPAVAPVPYTNIALNCMATQFSTNVSVMAAPALHMGSQIPSSSGNEPGVAHPTIKGRATYTAGNSKVTLNGHPAITLTCPTTGNAMNAVGAVLVPSVTHVFYTYTTAAATSAARHDLREIARSLPQDGSAVDAALLADDVGYIRLRAFSTDVPSRVHGAVKKLEAQGARGLVVDLRDNPGGELTSCLELAGDFLDRGSILVRMTDGEGDETVYRARHEHPYRHPLVLLVNRGTASAAELFTGCLQTHQRAVVLGEATYGKGIGVSFVPGPGGLHTSFATFTLPGGEAIQGAGVHPDRALPADEDLLAQAVELLQHLR